MSTARPLGKSHLIRILHTHVALHGATDGKPDEITSMEMDGVILVGIDPSGAANQTVELGLPSHGSLSQALALLSATPAIHVEPRPPSHRQDIPQASTRHAQQARQQLKSRR